MVDAAREPIREDMPTEDTLRKLVANPRKSMTWLADTIMPADAELRPSPYEEWMIRSDQGS